MKGKILRKLLPLTVSASLLMGSAASVMADNLESASDVSAVSTIEADAEDSVNDAPLQPEDENMIPFSDEENVQKAEEVQEEEESIEETGETHTEEADVLPEEEQHEEQYSVYLRSSYPHVDVKVSDNMENLPVQTQEEVSESEYEEVFSDEDLVLVTVNTENEDHLVTAGELEALIESDNSSQSEDTQDNENAAFLEQMYAEGTTVYVSAVPEDGYAVDLLYAVGEDGTFIDVEEDLDNGLYSFVMPAMGVDIDVYAVEEQYLNPADFTETEIEALEQYVTSQGLPVSTGAMLLAASEVRTITFNMNGFISYSAEGYGSGMDAMFYISTANYRGNGNGYCLNPAVQAPGHDRQGQSISYTTTVTDYSDSMLLKIMYYGFGGPADITASYASTPTARHILTHMVAVKRAKELGIPGSGDYTYRANSTAIAKADALYNAIKAKSAINGTVSIFTPVAGQQTIMLLSSYSIPETKGHLELKKVSAKSELSSGNPNYSLEGAKYNVYADQALTNQVGSFTVAANGDSINVMYLSPGTYYVKETVAPKGYLLDTTVHSMAVTAGKMSTLTVSDMPANDPLTLLLEKKDAVTGKADSRLQGAEFTVKFYPVEKEADIATPKWTWVFATDANGRIRVDDAHKVGGDALIKDATTGATLVPLGFITIQETKAPNGYQINDTVYTCQITQDTNSVKVTNLPVGENAVMEQPDNTEIAVTKTVTGSAGNKNTEFNFSLSLANPAGGSLSIPQGLVCSVTENGKAPEEKTFTGKNGVFTFTLHHGQTVTFKGIPVGVEYKVKEIDGTSNGYTVENEETSGITTTEAVQINVINHKDMSIPTGADTNRNAMLYLAVSCLMLILVVGVKKVVQLKE